MVRILVTRQALDIRLWILHLMLCGSSNVLHIGLMLILNREPNIGTICSRCKGRVYETLIARLQCRHWMCHSCLLEQFANALISPTYMPPRCCSNPLGILHLDWSRWLHISQDLVAIYEKLQKLKSIRNWSCPNGHGNAPLMKLKGRIPIWVQPVFCFNCVTYVQSARQYVRLLLGSENRLSPFCLFCSRETAAGRCQCEAVKCVEDFIDKTYRFNHSPIHWAFSVLKSPTTLEKRMRDSKSLKKGSMEILNLTTRNDVDVRPGSLRVPR